MKEQLKVFLFCQLLKIKFFSKLLSLNRQDRSSWSRIKELLGSWQESWTFPQSFQCMRSAAMQSHGVNHCKHTVGEDKKNINSLAHTPHTQSKTKWAHIRTQTGYSTL